MATKGTPSKNGGSNNNNNTLSGSQPSHRQSLEEVSQVLDQKIQIILKEAHMRPEIKKQCISCLEWIAKFKDKKDRTDSKGVPIDKVERDRFSNQMAKLIKLCSESKISKLIVPALELCEKLISFDYFRGDTIDDENQEQRLISELIKNVTNCFTDSDESILLQIVRCFSALIGNTVCDVHERDLLTAIQTSYNVYLVTKSQNNRNAAKGGLKQSINIIFQRMELQMSPDVQIGVDDQPFDEEALEKVEKPLTPSKPATPSKVNTESTSFLSLQGLSNLFSGPKPVDEKERKKEVEEHCRSLVLYLVNYVEQSKKFEKQTNSNHVFNDCFLVFRSLCKLSVKEVPKGNSNDPNSLHNKSKILSLELLYQILENSGPVFRSWDKFINNAIKKHLIHSLLNNGVSSNAKVFQLSLKIFLALISHYKDYLKTQIGLFYSKIFLPILENPNSTIQQKWLLLQALLVVCKNPQALVDLFVNYDCDLDAIDIYERMVNVLSKIAQGTGNSSSDNQLKKDGLECLFYITKSLVDWSKDFMEQKLKHEEQNDNNNNNNNNQGHHRRGSSISELTTTLDQQSPDFGRLKQFKLLIKDGAARFEKSEKKGLRWFIEQQLVKDDPLEIATFFFKTQELSKRAIGEILGEKDEYFAAIRERYVSLFSLKGIPLDIALRKFLGKFRLPGEAQKIDRIIERFAGQYFDQNKGTEISPFANADAVYLFSFASVMLATDAHNPAIKPDRKMTKQQWYSQHRGGNDGSDFPQNFLSDVYDRIVAEPLRTTDTPSVSNTQELTDSKQKREIFATEMEDVIKSTKMALRERSSDKSVYYRAKQIEHVKPMFDIAWMPLLAAFSVVLENSEESEVIQLCLDGFKNSVRVACSFYLELTRNAFVNTLAKFTLLNTSLNEMKEKNIESIKVLLEIAISEGNFLQDSWEPILRCISHLEQLQFTSQSGPRQSISKSRSSTSLPNDSAEHSKKMKQEINSIRTDRVFSNTVNLDSNSIIEFVKALCAVSIDEIENPQPSMFSLQKLVELAHPNMDRIRIVWGRIWSILADHFTKIGSSYSMQVSIYAIDSLKQLAMKFLEKEELANYHFQKEFLKPFEVLMRTSKSTKVRDMIIGCIAHMVTARATNIKSGWKSIFVVLSLAGNDPDQNINSLSYQILQDITEKHFKLIADSFFVDCSACLVAFAKNKNFVSISIKSINLLFNLAERLGEGEVCELETKQDKQYFTDSETHLGLWFPILTGLSTTISHPNINIRDTALMSLFEILKNHGEKFSPNLWKLIFRGVLSPIFDLVQHTGSLQKDENDWLKQTCLPALEALIKLFTRFFQTISFLLPDMLALISSCVLQDNENLARIGATCFLQLVTRNGEKFSVDMWTMICENLSTMIKDNAPHDLQEHSGSDPKQQRTSTRVIQGKCTVQLGLVEALQDIAFQFYSLLGSDQLIILLDALDHNYTWTNKTHTHREISAYIAKIGIGELLLREEISALNVFLKLLFHIYATDKKPDRLELCEKRLIPRTIQLLQGYLHKSKEPTGETKRILVGYTPIMIQILTAVVNLHPSQFTSHLVEFYPLLTNFILIDNKEMRALTSQFFQRVSKELNTFQSTVQTKQVEHSKKMEKTDNQTQNNENENNQNENNQTQENQIQNNQNENNENENNENENNQNENNQNENNQNENNQTQENHSQEN